MFEPSENWVCNMLSQSLLQRTRIFAELWRLNFGAMPRNSSNMNPHMVILRPLDYPILEVELQYLWSKNEGIVADPQTRPEIVRVSRSHNLPPIQNIFPRICSRICRNEFWWESDAFLYHLSPKIRKTVSLIILILSDFWNPLFQNGPYQ